MIKDTASGIRIFLSFENNANVYFTRITFGMMEISLKVMVIVHVRP